MVDPVSQYITGQHPVKGILGTSDITRTATVPVQIYLSWELPLILVGCCFPVCWWGLSMRGSVRTGPVVFQFSDLAITLNERH